ncbi:MAG TPA: TetR/AcrR family transcriptional regulator [Virgibacillus sp.]|nr:TetR/AcrR family transcriptional regulator [Virgibacillus sp.]
MAIDRRQQIIDAATKSFSLYGYKATTMDQVAKLGNVGKGTIYTFFKNKEELFDVIITDLITNMRQVATEAIDPSLPFKNNVHQALYGMLEFRLKHQLTIKLFQEDRDIGTPIVQDVMGQVENEILSFISDKVRIAIDNKQIQDCDPELTAFILMKLYIALIFDWERNHEPLGKEDIAKIFDLYLLQGLSI